MKLLTEKAWLRCKHGMSKVDIHAGQSLVFALGSPVLVSRDPEQRPVTLCPLAPPMKTCTLTINEEKGYSDLLQIEGHQVCLDTLTGLTDGGTPGDNRYLVQEPGQDLVEEAES